MTVGDVGVVIRFTALRDGLPANISAVVAKAFHFTPPSGPAFTRPAVFTTDGSDGKLEYTITTGDVTVPGQWTVRAHLTDLGGFTGYSTKILLSVDDV